MPTIADVAAQLRLDGRPILFLDTCSLLDVIRATYRCLDGCVQRAYELLGMASAIPPQCTLVVASMVPGEWNDHAQAVREEVEKHLAKLQNHAAYFHDACKVLGIIPGFGLSDYPRVGLADALHDLSQKLLDNAVRLDADSDCTNRGVARVVRKIPPSRQGGEVKDCVIIEECLEVCRRLAGTGFAAKRLFCTSNTADYGIPGGSLHPTLATEFASIGLGFTTSLPWAVHELKS